MGGRVPHVPLLGHGKASGRFLHEELVEKLWHCVSRPPAKPTNVTMKPPTFFAADAREHTTAFAFLPEGVRILAQDKRSAVLGKYQ
jgi:hypothetical protein